MEAPASPHFTPVDLAGAFNVRRSDLPPALRPPAGCPAGPATLLGIPFVFGSAGGADAVLLADAPASVELGGSTAAHLVIAHVAEDRATSSAPGLPRGAVDGNGLGATVARYLLEYVDGGVLETPIRRRFAVQQARVGWGASAFEAVPARAPLVVPSASEAHRLGIAAPTGVGLGNTRHVSGRDAADDEGGSDLLWLYALTNPEPARPLARLLLMPVAQRSVVYALSRTALRDHPLRWGRRRTLRLRVPAGARRDALGGLPDAVVDLGVVIAVRPALDYDHDRWRPGQAQVEPTPAPDEVLIEVAAHAAARLHVPCADGPALVVEPAAPGGEHVLEVPAAERPVRIRIVDAATGVSVAARLHLHGDAGQYLPPRGHHRAVNGYWTEDHAGELVTVHNQYAYVDGRCVVDLPLGRVHVEISRGYEITPIRTTVTVDASTDELVFPLEKALRWREDGWVTADTHVHFLSPTTALLEGQAEGVNVVNLLASQWGELFSNVADFDGATTLGAREFGGGGEFLVRVGTENRMQVLGHLSLLGYTGEMIHPLCTGGPSESALGDALEVTMADWARRCRDQGGLVVLPHAPNPRLEAPADVVLGLIHALELMTGNPLHPASGHLSPYGLADWYRYLNLGYRLPLVGGSDKMAASMLLGGIRTYARIGAHELTYQAWMDAVRDGDTFATVGPLVSVAVEGVRPGGRVELPAGGGSVAVDWRVESVALPVERVELVVGGFVAEEWRPDDPRSAEGRAGVRIREPSWVALRVRGSYRGEPEDVAAHTSAVQVTVGGAEPFSALDAADVLDQIQGALAYVETIATRPDRRRLQELRTVLEGAYGRLHRRLHARGVLHRHHEAHPPHDGHDSP